MINWLAGQHGKGEGREDGQKGEQQNTDTVINIQRERERGRAVLGKLSCKNSYCMTQLSLHVLFIVTTRNREVFTFN